VAVLADRAQFDRALDGLLKAGFSRADLSVLTSHDSIDAAGRPGSTWRNALTAIAAEAKYEVPLVASGLILLAGGPVAAAVSAVVGAAVGGIALKELLGEISAAPHTEDFARAIEAGSIILWVRAPDRKAQERARTCLAAAGGVNVHVHEG
jgi:hypothetical protein